VKLSTFLREVMPAIIAAAERVEEAEAAGHREWIDQSASPLGARRHINAVQRRIAAGDPSDAARVGRRWLLSRDAVAAELATISKRPARKARSNAVVAPVTSMADRLTAAAQRGSR
jgi:uncharacterized protein (DUF1684 family)